MVLPVGLLETPRGLISLGVQLFGGLEQMGIKGLQDCIKVKTKKVYRKDFILICV